MNGYADLPKDFDRQTREEFNRFQEGCVEENTNTAALVRHPFNARDLVPGFFFSRKSETLFTDARKLHLN